MFAARRRRHTLICLQSPPLCDLGAYPGSCSDRLLSAITNHSAVQILMLSLCPSSPYRPLCCAWHEADCGCGCDQVRGKEGCLWWKSHQGCTEGWEEEVNFHAGHPAQSAVPAAAAAAVAHHIAAPLLLSHAAFSQAQLCRQGLA